MIVFKKIDSIEPVADYLAKAITHALANHKRTVWFIPGGSSMTIVLEVATRLKGIDLRNLAVTLTDERFGMPDYADSNWQQLEQQGFFLAGATLLPVLVGEDRSATTIRYDHMLETLLSEAAFKLGFFGVGPDGHIAGILPHSLAVGSKELAASYEAPHFERITMTPRAIGQLDEAVVYAVGEPKHHVMRELGKDLALSVQPAQILKNLPKVVVFNDYKGKAV